MMNIQGTWQNQPTMTPLTASLLRRTALAFERREQIRAGLGLLSMIVFSLFFGLMATFGDVFLCRAGCALLALSPANAFYTLARYGWTRSLPAGSAGWDCASHYREQLVRLRDLHRAFVSRQLLPLIPGVALGLTGWILAAPGEWMLTGGIAILFAGFQYTCWDLAQREAARIEKEIELLDQA